VCPRCGLRRCVDRVLSADGHGPLQPLREVLLRADPLSTRLWLDRTHDLLTDLDQGRIPLEHTTLDALPHRKAIEHLRALLIATEILPPDPGRDLRWLDRDLPTLLAGLRPADQQPVRQWTRWVVLPRLRTRVERGGEVTVSVANARRQIEQVAAFLTALRDAGRDLGTCIQHDINAWFAQPAAICRVVRPFLAWARRHRHLPVSLQLPPSYRREPRTSRDAELRWDRARRLVDDDTLDPADRVAGALVVLYAQPLTRIVTLTTADVVLGPDRVQLRLGPDPLDIPEPFAALLRGLPRRRRDSTAEQITTPWLFPGGHAGRHLGIAALGQRLRRIGIEPRRLRLAATDQLCREIPPALLAGVLGLRTATVAHTTLQTSGQWATYAATRRSTGCPNTATAVQGGGLPVGG
jgi:hypothetical protein